MCAAGSELPVGVVAAPRWGLVPAPGRDLPWRAPPAAEGRATAQDGLDGGDPPAGSRGPPDGLRARLDRVPGWLRLWYRTPWVDRYAHRWMWDPGGWDVLPPPDTGSGP